VYSREGSSASEVLTNLGGWPVAMAFKEPLMAAVNATRLHRRGGAGAADYGVGRRHDPRTQGHPSLPTATATQNPTQKTPWLSFHGVQCWWSLPDSNRGPS